ncbi:hypothetical protein ACFQH8_21755 [Halomicroarcula sp. GCM10025710]
MAAISCNIRHYWTVVIGVGFFIDASVSTIVTTSMNRQIESTL